MPSYYIAKDRFGNYDLAHYGILGMKWGVRRYQNADGSLTAAGEKRYGNLKKQERRISSDLNDNDKAIAIAKYHSDFYDNLKKNYTNDKKKALKAGKAEKAERIQRRIDKADIKKAKWDHELQSAKKTTENLMKKAEAEGLKVDKTLTNREVTTKGERAIMLLGAALASYSGGVGIYTYYHDVGTKYSVRNPNGKYAAQKLLRAQAAYDKSVKNNWTVPYNKAVKRYNNGLIQDINSKWEKRFSGYKNWADSPLYDKYTAEVNDAFAKVYEEEMKKAFGKRPE